MVERKFAQLHDSYILLGKLKRSNDLIESGSEVDTMDLVTLQKIKLENLDKGGYVIVVFQVSNQDISW